MAAEGAEGGSGGVVGGSTAGRGVKDSKGKGKSASKREHGPSAAVISAPTGSSLTPDGGASSGIRPERLRLATLVRLGRCGGAFAENVWARRGTLRRTFPLTTVWPHCTQWCGGFPTDGPPWVLRTEDGLGRV